MKIRLFTCAVGFAALILPLYAGSVPTAKRTARFSARHTLWRYSGLAGFEVLSRIVEIVSGQTYDVFLKERVGRVERV